MALALFLIAVLLDYRVALPGYHYQFPRDHFNHPEYRTEWWYYTGNVRTHDGHRYGFELVFFRQGPQEGRKPDKNASAWRVDDIYLAHLAMTDLDPAVFDISSVKIVPDPASPGSVLTMDVFGTATGR